MASKITFECPSCFAKLNISDPSKLGKKIKCPKCQEVFAPEPMEPEVIDDDFEDEEPKSPSSRKRAAGGSKGSSKKSAKGKSSGSGSNVPLIIAGVVAVLALVGVGLYFSGVFASKPAAAPVAAASPPMQMMAAPLMSAPPPSIPQSSAKATELSPAEKVLGTRWLPTDTDLLIHLKMAELWQAPLLKPSLNNPAVTSVLKEVQKTSDIGPADIETVTMGMRGMNDAFATAFAAGVSGKTPPPVRPETMSFVIVMKTKKPMELNQLLKGTKPVMKEIKGKTYAESPPAPFAPPGGVWSPDPKTFIFATIKELIATIENGETATPRKEFTSLDPLPLLTIATVIPDTGPESKVAKELQNSSASMALAIVQPYSLKMVEVGLTIKGGFDLQVSALSGTEDGAKQLKSVADLGQTMLRSQFDNYKKTGLPLVVELGDKLLSNLKIEEKDQIVKVSTNVPDSDQTKIEQLGPILMVMAMTGGFNQFGRPNAAGLQTSPGLDAAPAASAKLPGETDAVAAVKSEGLPDGLTLSARTGWSPSAASSSDAAGSNDAAAAPTVEIVIDVTGDGLESICGASGMSTKTMTIAGGSLKKIKKQGGADSLKNFFPFDAKDLTSIDHPPGTLRVRMQVEAPSSSTEKIDVLEGSFKFLTSTETKEFSIDEVPRKLKRVITDPDLKAVELKWRRGPSGESPESFTVYCGKDHVLGKIVGNPGDVVSVTDVEKDQTVQRMISNHADGKFPEDFQIKFAVHPSVKEHTVTFRFEGVPLPIPDSKPQ